MTNDLSRQELHYLAMKLVGEEIEEKGYEFLAINSEIQKNPQFVLFKKGEPTIFVVVKVYTYPQDPNRMDTHFINKMVDHAKAKEAKLWYAPVGFANEKDLSLPIRRNESYLIKYDGIKKIL